MLPLPTTHFKRCWIACWHTTTWVRDRKERSYCRSYYCLSCIKPYLFPFVTHNQARDRGKRKAIPRHSFILWLAALKRLNWPHLYQIWESPKCLLCNLRAIVDLLPIKASSRVVLSYSFVVTLSTEEQAHLEELAEKKRSNQCNYTS